MDDITNTATDAPDPEMALSLEEFCRRLSASDSRVELIGGFHHDEKANGRMQDTETAFRARFAAFADRPVL